MKKLIALIFGEGKSPEQLKKEARQALEKFLKTNNKVLPKQKKESFS